MFLNKTGSVSWLVVFLGNPGPKYACTRHNAGFMAGEALEKKLGVSINRLRFKALTAAAEIHGEKALLEAARFYRIPPEHVIVVSDEVSLPLARLRVRPKGSAGGHNGLKSIIAALGSDAFPRIRIGVGAPPHPDYDMADWVLSVFRDRDLEDMRAAADRAAEAVICYIGEGPERTMNLFNA